MNLSEILRALADKIDSIEQPAADHDHNTSPNQAALVPVEVDNVDHTEAHTFVAPLQQKIELLKKAVGVDSIYDEPCDTESDEMDIMKRNAGINSTAIHIASEDNDILE
jgi:hypothetical protein